jgi:hypothetical protein
VVRQQFHGEVLQLGRLTVSHAVRAYKKIADEVVPTVRAALVVTGTIPVRIAIPFPNFAFHETPQAFGVAPTRALEFVAYRYCSPDKTTEIPIFGVAEVIAPGASKYLHPSLR